MKRKAIPDEAAFRWGVTHGQANLLKIVLSMEIASTELLCERTGYSRDTIKVHFSKIRSNTGFKILCTYSVGYHMDNKTRLELLRLANLPVTNIRLAA